MTTSGTPVTNHVVLVGMMGVGKSSLARRLGRSLQRPVFDTDAEIVSRTGRTIPEIFAAEGEPRLARTVDLVSVPTLTSLGLASIAWKPGMCLVRVFAPAPISPIRSVSAIVVLLA